MNRVQRIVGDYVTVDTEETVRRTVLRGQSSGRRVPEDIIRRTLGSVSGAFREAAERDLCDELRLFDNNGDTPRRTFERKNGVSSIIGPEAYEAFVRKGPDYPGD